MAPQYTRSWTIVRLSIDVLAMPVTIRDLAARVGMTVTTVSRAMNDDARVSKKTRRRIRQVAAEVGYRPDFAARSLATGSRETVAVLFAAPTGSSAPSEGEASLATELRSRAELLAGMCIVLEANDHHLMLASSAVLDPFHWPREALPKVLREGAACGLIVVGHLWPALLAEVASTSLLTIAVETPPSNDVTVIGVDEERCVEMLVDHLVELGHRRIAYNQPRPVIRPLARSLRGETWPRGYVNAMTRHGLDALPGWQDLVEVEAGLRALMALSPPPTAIIAYDDVTAAIAIRWLREHHHLRVPEDTSVCCVYDNGMARHFLPTLTVIERDHRHMGGLAAETLLELARQPRGRRPERILVAVRLLTGESTAPAPAARIAGV